MLPALHNDDEILVCQHEIEMLPSGTQQRKLKATVKQINTANDWPIEKTFPCALYNKIHPWKSPPLTDRQITHGGSFHYATCLLPVPPRPVPS